MTTAFQPHNIPHRAKRILPIPHEFDEAAIRYQLLTDLLNMAVVKSAIVSIDLETTGLDPYTSRPTLIGLSADGFKVLLLTHEDMQNEAVRLRFNKLMASQDVRKVFHNAKFDLKFLMHHYGTKPENVDCTYVMRRMLVAGLQGKEATLNACAYDYLEYAMDKSVREEFIGNTVMTEAMLKYAAIDVAATWHIYPILRKYIEIEQLHLCYDLIERPLVRVVAEMELRGVGVDLEYLQKLQKLLEAKTKKAQAELDATLRILGLAVAETKKLKENEKTPAQILAGITHVRDWKSFNVNSPKQVVETLNAVGFELESASADVLENPYWTRASLDRGRKLMKADLSDDEVLIRGRDLIRRVQDLRAARKALNAFIEPMQGKYLHQVTGRIHCSFSQLGTDTGRFSCSNPNFQQMPSERKNAVFDGLSFRNAFAPSPGMGLIVFDYQACELRIAAEISRDPGLLEAIKFVDPKTGKSDPHTPNAAIAYGVPTDQVTKEQRVNIKTAIYTIIYGGSAFTVAAALRIPVSQAQAFMDLIFTNFPGITQMIEVRRRFVREKGYCVSLSGRKRYFDMPRFQGDNREFDKAMRAVERRGQNTPIQATNADITKYAQVLLRPLLEEFGAHQLLSVHDELVIECPLEVIEACTEVVKSTMLKAEREFLRHAESAVSGGWGLTWEH